MGSRGDMIRTHFEAWNQRDREGMVRDLAEDIVVEDTTDFAGPQQDGSCADATGCP